MDDKPQESLRISLARMEERIVTVFNRQSSIETTMNSLTDKVDKLTEQVIAGRYAERVIWVLIVAAVSYGVQNI
jgi:hypothetical protein|tara:strand:- start:5747 stop:5968 length:222 start_codon:yes stop_codon:yes gene_type:complete